MSNIIENGKVVKDLEVSFDEKKFECVDKGFGEEEENVDIVIRPEDILINESGKGMFDGVVEDVIFKGVHYEILVKTAFRIFKIHTINFHDFDEKVSVS